LFEYWPYRYDYPYAGIRLLKYGRSKGATAKIPYYDIPRIISENGLQSGEYIISSVPIRDTGPGLQGELSWSPDRGEWNLYCALERGYQRKVLAENGQYLSGPGVILVLRDMLPVDDVEDLLELHEFYSEGVSNPTTIEFAQTDRIGWNPNRSVLIWEIRHH
jgi:hypothetical protein